MDSGEGTTPNLAHRGTPARLPVRQRFRPPWPRTGLLYDGRLMEDVVAAARQLGPEIRAASDQIELERRLPEAIADAMAARGLFGLLTPAAYGGVEAEPTTAMRAVEEIGRADGSAGWLALNGSYEAALLGWLSAETIAEMRSADPRLRVVGATRPQGTAYRVDGGYRASGRWDFVSGVTHANWVLGGVVLLDGRGGEPQRLANGEPVTRIVFVPRDAGTVIDAWNTMGMRGTGSHDFTIEEEFVPSARTMSPTEPSPFPGPRYREPYWDLWGWTLHGANSLGIARGALDDLRALPGRRSSGTSPAVLQDRPVVQAAAGEAEAIVRGARAFLFESVQAAWTAACADADNAVRVSQDARLALTHAVLESRRAVGLVYDAVGTNAIFREHRIERAFRDLSVAQHHLAASRRHYESAGSVLLASDGS